MADIIIILILLWGAWRGWKAGLIKELFSTVGIVAGLVVATLFYKNLGEHFSPALGSGSLASYIGCVLAFVLLWVIVPILFGIIANILTQAVKCLCMGPINSLLGLVVGAFKYFVLISFVFSAMSYAGIISEQKKQSSKFYPYITVLGKLVLGDSTIADESGELEDKTVIIKFDRNSEDKNNAEERGE